jgi:hypothetical protein
MAFDDFESRISGSSGILVYSGDEDTPRELFWLVGNPGTDLGDTLLVLSPVEDCPCYSARVLALEEEGFGLSILEAEDFAITTNIELALCKCRENVSLVVAI